MCPALKKLKRCVIDERMSRKVLGTTGFVCDHVAEAVGFATAVTGEESCVPPDALGKSVQVSAGSITIDRREVLTQLGDKLLCTELSCGIVAGAGWWGVLCVCEQKRHGT